MSRQMLYPVLWLFGIFCTSCAFDLAHVSTQPTQFSPTSHKDRTIVLSEVVEIEDAPCGYDRSLGEGTHWTMIGQLPEGEVFKPVDQVLTIECSNIFEAYLVLKEGHLVGFYLPVEKTFSPLSEKIKIPLQ